MTRSERMNWSQQLPDRTTCVDCKDLDAGRAFPADAIHRASDGFSPARSPPERHEVAPVTAGPALTVAELASNAGLYRDVATDAYGRVYVRDGKLWASMDAGEGPADSVELRPIDMNRFSIPGAPVVAEFVAPSEGRPRQVRVTGAGPKPFVSEQVVEGFAPTAAELREYAGRYANAASRRHVCSWFL